MSLSSRAAALYGVIVLGWVSAGAGPASMPTADGTVVATARIERSALRIDVLELRVAFTGVDEAGVSAWTEGRGGSRADEDSLVRTLEAAENVRAEMRFLRDVSVRRMLEAFERDLNRAARAGWLPEQASRRFVPELEALWEPFRRYGFHTGDRLIFRLGGDSLSVKALDARGQLEVSAGYAGPHRRGELLGVLLAEGTEFRPALVRSLRR